jgi:DNA-binding response OmpR family regulator
MEQKVKLLLAEDDENLGLLLKEYLIAKGFDTMLYPDGEAAFKGFMKGHFDICILDVMMPKKDGFTLAREMRLLNGEIPIIFLTAKNLKDDIIEGFKLGADDYITKPFSMEELIFRIEAILRRTSNEAQAQNQQIYKLGRYTFDTRKQTLTNGEDVVKLTTKESDLLKLLCQHANKVLERNFALKSIWIEDNYFNARSMDVYITKLRKHLKEEPSVEIINVHGKGYKLIV